MGINIRFYVRDPGKALPCAEPPVLACFASKSVQGLRDLDCSELKEPKKTIDTFAWRAKPRMHARKRNPLKLIVTNSCTGVGVHDVITCAIFITIDYGVWVCMAGVKFWAFTLTCVVVALTTLSYCECASD